MYVDYCSLLAWRRAFSAVNIDPFDEDCNISLVVQDDIETSEFDSFDYLVVDSSHQKPSDVRMRDNVFRALDLAPKLAELFSSEIFHRQHPTQQVLVSLVVPEALTVLRAAPATLFGTYLKNSSFSAPSQPG